MILGCNDGSIRALTDDLGTDCGSTVTSKVLLGPFLLGGHRSLRGVLAKLDADLDPNSDDVTFNVYTGANPRDAYEQYVDADVAATGTLSAGVNYSKRPAVGGVCCYIELTSTGRWALEQMLIQTLPRGPARKL
jgi:hypothetical protein